MIDPMTFFHFWCYRSTQPFSASPDFSSRLAEDNPRDYASRDFSATASRHTYYARSASDPTAATASATAAKRLNVRLRARQVLCNNCKSVCNERGERVRRRGAAGATRRRRSPEEEAAKERARRQSLYPRVRRLRKEEIERHAKADSLEGAAMGFQQLTISCVSCHSIMRQID